MKNMVWRVNQEGEKAKWLEEELKDPANGEVQIKVAYSSINYKDALGFTSKGKIFKKFPIIPGIDLSGLIVKSKSPKFKEGDSVVVTGCGLGENYDGGYAQYLNVNANNIITLPKQLNLKNAMLIGTAGFTAALALYRMEKIGQVKGKILITGASGGVGSFATLLFAKKDYQVLSLSGKKEITSYLKSLGANEVWDSKSLALGERPLESVRFQGAVDSVGGDLLSKIIPHIDLYGNIASIGLAGGHKISTTVMPFILRGVSLIGISSNNCPMDIRKEIWQDLSTLSQEDFLKIQSQEVALEQIDQHMEKYFQREVVGRFVVKNT